MLRLESSNSIWFFDVDRMRFRRVPRGTDPTSPALANDWQPYFGLEVEADTGAFTVALNEDGTRRLRAVRVETPERRRPHPRAHPPPQQRTRLTARTPRRTSVVPSRLPRSAPPHGASDGPWMPAGGHSMINGTADRRAVASQRRLAAACFEAATRSRRESAASNSPRSSRAGVRRARCTATCTG